MTTEASLIDVALRTWKTNIDRAGRLFGSLSEQELQEEVAPGRNRRIYLWGHLTAINDALIPLLGFGERMHPELDSVFVSKPDRSAPDSISATDLKRYWEEINAQLSTEFANYQLRSGCKSTPPCPTRTSCASLTATDSQFC
jgi:hypothetical protein